MVDLGDEEAAFTPVPVEMIRVANPFPSDCLRLRVVKTINITQLADELEKALGVEFQLTYSALEDGAGYLFVSPPTSEDDILDVVGDHSPDPDYGLTADQKERSVLLAKLKDGKGLSQEELIRALVLALENG